MFPAGLEQRNSGPAKNLLGFGPVRRYKSTEK
jgi:hypothetical protein